MTLGYGDLRFRKCSAQFIRENGNDEVFGAEMIAIYEIYTKLLCLKKDIVFDIGGYESVAAALECFVKLGPAGAADNGDMMYGIAGVVVAESFGIQGSFQHLQVLAQRTWVL